MTSQAREIKIVADDAEGVDCDGGEGSLGHPMIYLRFEGRNSVDCYYCGQRFAKSDYEPANSRSAAS